MNVDIRWDNAAKTIVRYTLSGEWNWNDFYTALAQRPPELKAGSSTTILIDFRAVPRFPSDMISHLRDAAKVAEPASGLIILISNHTTVTTLFNLFVRIYSTVGKRLRLVNNDEEAYAIINQTLPND